MDQDPRYKVSLDPKVHLRSRIIFGILTALFLISGCAGIYAGVKTGKFESLVTKPLQNFWSDATKAEPTPSPLELPSPTSTPSLTPTPAQKAAPVVYATPVASCTNKNIREGEFASNKCYSQKDYDDLEYYLNRFNSAVFNKEAAESSMRITCDCSRQSSCDFFKDSCDRDKQKLSQAESDIQKYRATIQGIIARGK